MTTHTRCPCRLHYWGPPTFRCSICGETTDSHQLFQVLPYVASSETGWCLWTVNKRDDIPPTSAWKQNQPEGLLLSSSQHPQPLWWPYMPNGEATRRDVPPNQALQKQEIELYFVSWDSRICLPWLLALITLTNSIWEMCTKSLKLEKWCSRLF